MTEAATATDLPDDQWLLLLTLRECHAHGSFSVACDGKDRMPAHDLEQRGFVEWKGRLWGSHFWALTDEGRAYIDRHSAALNQS